MTREDAIKILTLLKAAYPNSYKNMTKDDANGTIAIWSIQFARIPVSAMLIVINKHISSEPFPPVICEIKEKLRNLYYESKQMLEEHEYNSKKHDPVKIRDMIIEVEVDKSKILDSKTIKVLKEIVLATAPLTKANKNETSLSELLSSDTGLLIEAKL